MENKVKRHLKTLACIVLVAMIFASCKKAPSRISFGSGVIKGGEGTVTGSTPGGTTPIENPNTPEARKETIETIMLSAGDAADDSCKAKPLKGRASLRLLTKDEYQNSVKSILKVSGDYRSKLPRDAVFEGFRNNVDFGRVSEDHAALYLEAAIEIADEINGNIKSLGGCSAVDEACASKFIDAIGRKLWRRPLETAEKDSLKGTYKAGAGSSVRHGMTMMISRMLMSPNFLYRSEIGKDGALTPYELASALSYFFWGTSPDDSLIALAASGKLSEEATLVAEAQRLLKDEKSRFATTEFARAWLDPQSVKGAIKDESIFPGFSQTIRDAMAAEAEDTFDFMVRDDLKFENLFNSDFSIGNSTLARYYGAELKGDKISFAGTSRKGVLGYGAVLSLLASPKETHPIRRGNFVLGKVFCQYPDPTPPGLNVAVPEYDPKMSTRERFAKHTESQACASCHKAIDGIGLGMEDFDGAGLFRENQAGKKVDTSGVIVNIDGRASSSFSGLGSLSDYIAKSKQAKRCFAVEWYRLAHGHMERPQDICAMRDVANSFESGDMSLGELLVRIITHPSYRSKGE